MEGVPSSVLEDILTYVVDHPIYLITLQSVSKHWSNVVNNSVKIWKRLCSDWISDKEEFCKEKFIEYWTVVSFFIEVVNLNFQLKSIIWMTDSIEPNQ